MPIQATSLESSAAIERPELLVSMCALALFLNHTRMDPECGQRVTVNGDDHEPDAQQRQKTENLIEAVENLIIWLQDALDEDQIQALCNSAA
jgi:hypothetical protein